jgi:hypothetical protein
VLSHCLLIPYGPPHYGMGYTLYQLLGGCAPWPGKKRWVLICFTSVCVDSDLLHIRLCGLWPPTTSMLSTARLWQQSILQ